MGAIGSFFWFVPMPTICIRRVDTTVWKSDNHVLGEDPAVGEAAKLGMDSWSAAAMDTWKLKWVKAPCVRSGAAVAPTAMRADAEVRRQKQRLGRGVCDAPKVMDSRARRTGRHPRSASPEARGRGVLRWQQDQRRWTPSSG